MKTIEEVLEFIGIRIVESLDKKKSMSDRGFVNRMTFHLGQIDGYEDIKKFILEGSDE